MTVEHKETHLSKGSPEKSSALQVGVWFACIGGLAVPLVLWAFMSGSILVLGPDFGLKVSIFAQSLLTMLWPTVILLIAPGLGLGVIAALLLLNMFLWGAIGFLSQKAMRRSYLYYGLLMLVIFGLLISNGGFIWMVSETPKIPFDLIEIPTFAIAAGMVAAVFILRRRRVLKQFQ